MEEYRYLIFGVAIIIIKEGLEKTYHWIEDMLINKKNDSLIFQKS